MARRVIGLDIGTTAVRAVEVSAGRRRPSVRRLGQAVLPAGAVVAGEIVDVDAVAGALNRLWRASRFSTRDVVVGVANARVVARTLDLPPLEDDELRASLDFHVADQIPMRIEDAQLDLVVLDRSVERVRAIVIAAHRDVLDNVLSAVAGAKLRAARIDFVPLALPRGLADVEGWPDGSNEVLVGAGAGVTNVVVHRAGVPHFVRTLPSGGATVTDALAFELGVAHDDAEAIKRGLAGDAVPASIDIDGIARGALQTLVSEIATSVEYHVNQLPDAEVHRLVLTGGGSRLATLGTMLEEQLGVHVAHPEPWAGVRVGKLRLDKTLVSGSADLFTAALGLALGRGVDLVPTRVLTARRVRRHVVTAALAGAGVAAGLTALTVAHVGRAHRAESAAAAAEQAQARLKAQVAGYRDVKTVQSGVTSRSEAVKAVLAGDIAWPRVLQDVATAVPSDAWLTTLNLTRPTTKDAGGPTVSITAKGLDQSSAAHWLDRATRTPTLAGVWLSASTAYEGGTRPLVQFASKANVVAPSDRAGTYTGGTK